jgi:hypothetical protein
MHSVGCRCAHPTRTIDRVTAPMAVFLDNCLGFAWGVSAKLSATSEQAASALVVAAGLRFLLLSRTPHTHRTNSAFGRCQSPLLFCTPRERERERGRGRAGRLRESIGNRSTSRFKKRKKKKGKAPMLDLRSNCNETDTTITNRRKSECSYTPFYAFPFIIFTSPKPTTS